MITISSHLKVPRLARSGLLLSPARKWCRAGYIINPILVKHFFVQGDCIWTWASSRAINTSKKRSWSVSRHLDRTTLVNTLWYEIFAGLLFWGLVIFIFFWGLREQSFAARIDWNFRWELNFCGKITQSTENGRDKMWHLRDLRKWCPLAWPFEQVSNVIFWLLWVRFLCLRERKSIDLTFYRFLNATFFTPVSDMR